LRKFFPQRFNHGGDENQIANAFELKKKDVHD
jgi:hypothetical protein